MLFSEKESLYVLLFLQRLNLNSSNLFRQLVERSKHFLNQYGVKTYFSLVGELLKENCDIKEFEFVFDAPEKLSLLSLEELS